LANAISQNRAAGDVDGGYGFVDRDSWRTSARRWISRA
jgi:hypothetical protein